MGILKDIKKFILWEKALADFFVIILSRKSNLTSYRMYIKSEV